MNARVRAVANQNVDDASLGQSGTGDEPCTKQEAKTEQRESLFHYVELATSTVTGRRGARVLVAEGVLRIIRAKRSSRCATCPFALPHSNPNRIMAPQVHFSGVCHVSRNVVVE